MHKFTRITAAMLLSVSLTATGVMAAYADETIPAVPGASNETVADPLAGTETPATDPTLPAAGDPTAEQLPAETGDPNAGVLPVQENPPAPAQPPIEFTSDDVAAATAAIRSAQYGEEVVYIGASAMRQNGYWTPSFLTDDTIHNQGNGWYSMQMILRNVLGNLIYRTYSSTTGWSPWVMNGQETAHLTDGSAVEAVQIRMAGVVTNDFDLYYQATLSDGTQLDWATDGQTAGTMATGKWMIGLGMKLVPKNVPFTEPTQKTMDTPAGTDGVQLHSDGLPTYKDGSGFPFTGWGWVNNQRYYFVNDQAVTGWQYIDGYKYYFDESTGKLVSDLRNLLGNVGPYMLKINRVTDTLTVYAQDGANGYILPIVSFLTTTGDDTPYGTFHIPEKYRWRLMYGDVYTQYAMRLKAGYMIHSVIFNRQNPYTLDTITYNNLGVGRSHGCTRLKTGEVKWIYDNCPVGTTVVIYDSVVNGPFERPVLEAVIPFDQNYDPTDPTIPEAVAAMQAAEEAKVREAEEEELRKRAQKAAEEEAKAQAEAEAKGLGASGVVQEVEAPPTNDTDTPADNGSTAAAPENSTAAETPANTEIAQPGEPIS